MKAATTAGQQSITTDERPRPPGLRSLLGPVRARLVVAVALQTLGAVAGVVPFVAVAELGRVLLSADGTDAERAWLVAWVAVIALVARLVLLLAASTITHLADIDLALDIRRRLAAHLGRLPLGWFTESSSGRVRKAVGSDVAALHHLVGHTFTDMAAAVTVPLVSLGYLFWVDWRMALLTLVPLAAGLAAYARAMSGSPEILRAYDESMARLSGASVEFAQGIAVVKTFGQVGRAHRRFAEAAEEFARDFRSWVRQVFKATGVMELLLSPVFVLLWVLATGTALIVTGVMPAVDLLPFVLLSLGLSAPVLALGYSASHLRAAAQAAGRINELLAAKPLSRPASPRLAADTHVRVQDVRYSYDGGRSLAVDGVSFDLPPGSVTALVGASGSGKSTLARLVARFDDVLDGRISIGGVDLREMGEDQLYRLVTFVFQDVRLLRTTVRDNIALARPDAKDTEVEAAARAAQIHDVVAALPRGYGSVVGEDAQLSGGEVQRVSIARALLADTPVVVLDEATAFADPESEAAIQEALSHLVGGRTLLVVAHRLNTVAGADQILVLDSGKMVESGRHEELLQRHGAYHRSWHAYRTTVPAFAPHALEVLR